MFVGKVKEPTANTDRLNKLVARWQDEAAFPRGREVEKQNAWAEHLKRVADACTTSEDAQHAPDTNNGAGRRAA